MSKQDQDTSDATGPVDPIEDPPTRIWPKVAAGLITVVIAVVLLWGPVELAESLIEWWQQETGFLGAVGFAAFYVFATVCFVPSALLAIGAGFLFGGLWGGLIALLCRPLGSLVAFLVGRHLARHRVQNWIEGWPKFEAIDQLTRDEPFRIVLLLRLVPILTFNVTNYVFGLTAVGWKKFFAGTFVGVLPGSLFYVYIGVATGDLTRALAMEEAPAMGDYLVTWIIGGLAFVGALSYLFFRARRYWREMMERQEMKMEESPSNGDETSRDDD